MKGNDCNDIHKLNNFKYIYLKIMKGKDCNDIHKLNNFKYIYF